MLKIIIIFIVVVAVVMCTSSSENTKRPIVCHGGKCDVETYLDNNQDSVKNDISRVICNNI